MNEQIKDGGSAFPLPIAVSVAGDLYDASETHPGMSLRDWFAGQALIAILEWSAAEGLSYEELSEQAYKCADAMLKARGVSS